MKFQLLIMVDHMMKEKNWIERRIYRTKNDNFLFFNRLDIH